MQGILLSLLIFVVSIVYLDAFLPVSSPRQQPKGSTSTSSSWDHKNLHRLLPWQPLPIRSSTVQVNTNSSGAGIMNDDDNNNSDNRHSQNSGPSSSSSRTPTPTPATTPSVTTPFTHSHIQWKLRPAPETSRLKRLWLRLAANMIRLDCWIFRKEPPVVLCPPGGQAVLEAWVRRRDHGDDHDHNDHNDPPEEENDGNNNIFKKKKKKTSFKKIGRFGFTTTRGPPVPVFAETVSDLYGIPSPGVTVVGCAAIIYMFVEPPYRKRELGRLALEVISLIQAIQGCDFTVLVVDDNGSGKLIEWYKLHGYSLAPKLQAVLGSPNAEFGVTMMAPTNPVLPSNCRIQWW